MESEKTQEEQPQALESSGNAEKAEPDYKALYEEAKRHSRAWEKRAKANKGAVEQWNASNEELTRAANKIAELSVELDKKDTQLKHRQMAEKISKNTGVPAEMLIGETEDEMNEWAKKMNEFVKQQAINSVSVPKAGKFEKSSGLAGNSLEDFAKQLLKKN